MLFLLALAVVASGQPTDQESVRVRFSQKGLDFGEDVAFYMIELIQKQASDKLKLPKIASGSFEITNLRFASMDLGKPEMTIVEGVGIQWKQPSAKIKVHGDWAIQTLWWNYGSLTLEANLNVAAVAGIHKSNGKLGTTSKGCSVKFNSFNLDLHNAFFTWIAGLMEGSITPEIKNAVCSEINTLLGTTLNGVIQGMPHNIPVGNIFNVVIEADSDPVFNAGHFDISARVKADSASNDVVFPFSPEPMIDPKEPSQMACILLSDYTLNTASYVAFSAGAIVESLPNAQIPATSPFLNTVYFKTTLPQLYSNYPDAVLTATVTNTRFPRIEFDADAILLDMPVDLTVNAGDALNIATLSIDISVKGAVKHANNVISGTISDVTHTTTVKSSQIGDIVVADITSIVDTILDNTVLPEINKIFQEGILLPIDQYVTLQAGVLEARDDFLKVCADLTLTDFTLEEIKKVIEKMLGEF